MKVSDEVIVKLEDNTRTLAIEFANFISSHHVFDDFNERAEKDKVEIYKDFLRIREIQKNKLK